MYEFGLVYAHDALCMMYVTVSHFSCFMPAGAVVGLGDCGGEVAPIERLLLGDRLVLDTSTDTSQVVDVMTHDGNMWHNGAVVSTRSGVQRVVVTMTMW